MGAKLRDQDFKSHIHCGAKKSNRTYTGEKPDLDQLIKVVTSLNHAHVNIARASLANTNAGKARSATLKAKQTSLASDFETEEAARLGPSTTFADVQARNNWPRRYL